MEDWANVLAHEFKKRENKPMLGCIIGTVMSPPPNLTISILEGQVFINEVYVLDYLLPDYERIIDLPFESAKGELTINAYEIDREDGKLTSNVDYKIFDLEVNDKKIVTKDTLKVDDEVLLLSSVDNQKFFLIGRVLKLGGL